MNIKNIVVTGASGEIGRHVIPELLKAGYKVRALEHEEPVKIESVEIMKGDLSDETLPKRLIADMDAVVHLANVKENRETFMSVNVRGTFAIQLDMLSDYIAEKLGIPVVEFEYDIFHDFQIDLYKSRSILGYNPKYNIIDIVDEAIEFRKYGGKRTPFKYPD